MVSLGFQGEHPDLEEEEERTPLVVGEGEELVVLSYFAEALLVHLEVLCSPFLLFHGDVHRLHPAVLNSRFIGTVQNFTCSKWAFVSVSFPSTHSIG